MKKILLALTLAAGFASAAAKYTVYESEHFELITDGPRGRAQEILAQFERVRSFFVRTMAIQDPILKPRIVVFQNEKDYKDHCTNVNTAAYYIALPQRDYIAMRPSASEYERRTTVHEYIHLLVRNSDVPMPLWMSEGVAELYSNIEQVKKTVRVGTPIPEHILLIRNTWLPLVQVVAADHESPYYNRRQHMGPFYGISWALVHMLALDQRYRPNFNKLAPALAAGAKPEEAFQRLYSKSIQEVETDLKAYIRGNTVSVVNYEVQFDKVDEKITGTPVTEYEWGVATADLLSGVRRHDQAAARLEALTNMEAQRPEAWESLAFVRMMHRMNGADTAFSKARALGSVHPQLGYYAMTLANDQKVAVEALTATVNKYPRFNEGRIRLAEMQMYNRDFQTAYNGLKAIPKISRKQVPLYFPVFIQTAWYLGKLDESRGAARQFAGFAGTDTERERAKHWTDFANREPHKQTRQQEREEVVFTAQEIKRNTEFKPEASDDGPPPLTYATGALVNLECKEPAILHIKSETGLLKLVIDSPSALQMVGATDGKGELTCGAQSHPAKVGYFPKEGLAESATGLARSIEFLK